MSSMDFTKTKYYASLVCHKKIYWFIKFVKADISVWINGK